MSKRQIILTAILIIFFVVAIMAASMLFFSRAMAALPARVASTATSQIATGNPTFVSVSALAFMPLNPNTLYRKDAGRQLLTLEGQSRNFTANNNIFVAPLALADKSVLTGMTVFGEDFDNQGAVWVRLKRCDHGQARCVTLIELSSTDSYALGQFETIKITIGVTQFTFLEAESRVTWLNYASLSGLKPASRKVFKPNCVSPKLFQMNW